MTKEEFSYYRRHLGKTQKELAFILGMSLRTIHSYEQGWRPIPPHVARYFYFLLANQCHEGKPRVPCWEHKQCLHKERCPAWEFQCGHFCWFVHGTLCEDWENGDNNKLASCKECAVFRNHLGDKT